ncbi:putative beta-carotene-binding protein [Schistocerca serialis cubense]|uniref:putative beta-carotene-binding protein n=1 Tax=Schistocerca serialis cubense TaxID=2023355 RepID=UPI00214E95F1|nr:putative beta-carotene-binding protein [Schistocerca serialis cubense]
MCAGFPPIGAPPIDPLDQLPPLTWRSNSRGLDVAFSLDNGRHTGLGRSIVDSLQVDTINQRIRVVTHIDGASTLEGTYTLAARILGIPLEGTGLFKVTMSEYPH